MFEEIQKQLNQPQLKLKQDVTTRWNSTYEMLSRILILKESVITTIALLRSDLSLTDHDWAVIEAAVPILKLFYDITVEISSEQNVSLSKVIPLANIMAKKVNKLLSDPLLEALNKEIDRRFVNIEMNQLTAEATILDPRFKGRGFRDAKIYDKMLNALKLKVGSNSNAATCTQRACAMAINETQTTSMPTTSSSV